MEIAIIIILVILILGMGTKSVKTKKKEPTSKKEEPNEAERTFDYSKGYQPKWMFTYNEKDAFNKMKQTTDKMGLYLFAKVRLFDLIEPKNDIEKRQGHIYKIQAKHVDFVVCSPKLVARVIIELDDASHDTQERTERDSFVDTVLNSCGYKVLHMRAIEPEKLATELESVFSPLSANTQ